MLVSMMKKHPDGCITLRLVRTMSEKFDMMNQGYTVQPEKAMPKPSPIDCSPMPRHETYADYIIEDIGCCSLQWKKMAGFKVELEDCTVWIADSEGLTEETYAERKDALARYFELASADGCHETSSIIA